MRYPSQTTLRQISAKKIRSLEVRCLRVNRARNNTYFAKSKRKYFLFAPPPHPPPRYLRDRTASNNLPPPGPKGWTCPGGCLGVGDGNK